MLNKELQHNLFELLDSVEGLYRSSFFSLVKKAVEIFHNYEIEIKAEIVSKPIIEKLTIAKIDKDGIKILPEEFLREEYNKYNTEKAKEALNELSDQERRDFNTVVIRNR